MSNTCGITLKYAVFLLFLILISQSVSAACCQYLDESGTIITMFPNPTLGRLDFVAILNRTTCGGCVLNNSDSVYVQMLFYNNSIANAIVVNTTNFAVSCPIGDQYCWFSGYWIAGPSYNSWPISNATDWFSCTQQGIFVPPRTTTYTYCSDLINYYRNVELGYAALPAYSAIYSSATKSAMYGFTAPTQTSCLYSSTDAVNGSYYFINRDPKCTECNDGDPDTCSAIGDVNSGILYECVNGHWVAKLSCELGGFSLCLGKDSPAECPGVESQVFIANKNRVPYRISVTTDKGYELIYDSVNENYWLLSGQQIIETAFRLIGNDTLNDWPISTSDSLNINYSWNTVEVSCAVIPGGSVYDNGQSLYASTNRYTCTLDSSVVSADINVTVTANLTSTNEQMLLNTTLYQRFVLHVIRDTPLMDNFQVIVVNSSHIAFSGHIIRFSDLTEIPEASNPFVYINYSVYDNVTGVLKFSGTTGKLNQTNLDYLYAPIAATGQADGDRYIATMLVGAGDYANWSYLPKTGLVSPHRVLYFKCKNQPKNTTYDSVSMSTENVTMQCTYKLKDESALSVLSMSISSRVYQSIDISAGLFGTYPLPYLTSSALEQLIREVDNPLVANPSTWRNIIYVNSIGAVLQYVYYTMSYVKMDGSGNKQVITTGRYILPEAILDNPNIHQVNTYTDLIVEPSNPFEFIMPEHAVQFDKNVYNENDSVTCSVFYYDPINIVRGWTVTIDGDSGHSTTLSSGALPLNISESLTFSGMNCTPNEIGSSGRLCKASWSLQGIQSCTNMLNNSDTCLSYKWKFFDSGGARKLTCTVTLYAATFEDGISKSATTTVLIQTKDIWSSVGWNWWLLIFLIILFLIIMLIKSAGGPKNEVHIHNPERGR